MITTASRVSLFTESVIREMTRLALEHNAVNLAQGFPDFPAPAELLAAASRALAEGHNQYAITWGSPRLREAIAEKVRWFNGIEADPERNVTVTCGATEAMIATLLATVNPGDEVIVFEPFYENYGPDAILCGARPVYVPMPLDGPLDLERLAAAFSDRTRAIIVNTPNNPTGRVLSREELQGIAALCVRHGAWAITDEIYEHIRYEGEHVGLAALPGMRERTVVVSGASKTFSITGWRVGWILAPPGATAAIRKVHDFLTVGAPAPLQDAVATALDELPRGYYEQMSDAYRARRDLLCGALTRAGFRLVPPQGAYYVLADYGALADEPDPAFAVRLVKEAGVATVPASSFFRAPDPARRVVRFAFCKTEDVLAAAAERIATFAAGRR